MCASSPQPSPLNYEPLMVMSHIKCEVDDEVLTPTTSLEYHIDKWKVNDKLCLILTKHNITYYLKHNL